MSSPSEPVLSARTPVGDFDSVDEQPQRKKFWTPRVIIGIVVFCGVVCASVGAAFVYTRHESTPTTAIVTQIQQAPGLRVTIQAKRSSMEFNGQTSATVYVVPRSGSGTNLAFDAYLSQPGPNVTANFMLLNNRAYWSFVKDNAVVSAGCLAPNQVPPVQLMQASLESSVVVKSVSGQTIDCPQGKLLQLVFAGETFVFCNSNTNQLTKAVGEDLDMTIEYLSDPTLIPDFDVPQVPGSTTPLDCPIVTSDSSVATSTSRRLESASTSTLRRTAALGSSSCGCKGKMKPCLFVHGVGQKTTSDPTTTFTDSWGDIHNHAPCCSSFAFAHYNSVIRGWNEVSSQQEFCKTALKVSSSSANTFDNMILVTFSMGNLIASGAIASGQCSMGSGVTWVSLAGPMQGSKAANLLEEKCNSGGWGSALAGILDIIGYCPATAAYLNMKTQDTVDASLRNQYYAAQSSRTQRAKKLLCGTKSSGLVTVDAAALSIVSNMAYGDGTVNDGVVAFPSCSVGFGNFDTDSGNTNANYKASINHLDSSFRNGDGWWGADRKPIKWFECSL